MSSNIDRDRLSELAGLLCDELISDEQFSELDEMLGRSAEARQWYRVYMGMHRDLEQSPLLDTGPLAGVSVRSAESSRPFWSAQRLLMAIAATVLVAVSGTIWMRSFTPEVVAPQAYFAKITHRSDDLTWLAEGTNLLADESIGRGHLRLGSGLIRLQYQHGVVLSLMGPADLEVLTSSHSILHRGQLAAYVPDGAEGFRVDTPNAGVVDLGTEFGVTVDESGETQLSVFDGKVELTPSSPNSLTTVVSSGHAYHVDNNGNTKRLNQMAAYQEARDSLRGWHIVWEPFGPGSQTGPFPGAKGAGWMSPWSVDVGQGDWVDPFPSVSSTQPLHPGTEFYLTLAGYPVDKQASVRVSAQRGFGPVDQFTTSQPYTIELLVRIESPLKNVERIRVFSLSIENDADPAWELNANRNSPSGELSWTLPQGSSEVSKPSSLAIKDWETYRCFVEVNPQSKTWRLSIANFNEIISTEFDDAIALSAIADGLMSLGFEAIGREGKKVRFSVDGIRVQNRPVDH